MGMTYYRGGIPIHEWNKRYEWCSNHLKKNEWTIDEIGSFKMLTTKAKVLYNLRWL